MTANNIFNVISKPNCSLSVRARKKLFIFLSIIPLSIGIAFAVAGFWIILPFTCIELSALAYAFHYINRHDEDYESITVSESEIIVERRCSKQTTRNEMNPYWAKVVLESYRLGAIRVLLQSHGKGVEVGYFMNNQERLDLAQQLRFRTGMQNGSR